mgnify:CR=1 FL=1
MGDGGKINRTARCLRHRDAATRAAGKSAAASAHLRTASAADWRQRVRRHRSAAGQKTPGKGKHYKKQAHFNSCSGNHISPDRATAGLRHRYIAIAAIIKEIVTPAK